MLHACPRLKVLYKYNICAVVTGKWALIKSHVYRCPNLNSLECLHCTVFHVHLLWVVVARYLLYVRGFFITLLCNTWQYVKQSRAVHVDKRVYIFHLWEILMEVGMYISYNFINKEYYELQKGYRLLPYMLKVPYLSLILIQSWFFSVFFLTRTLKEDHRHTTRKCNNMYT